MFLYIYAMNIRSSEYTHIRNVCASYFYLLKLYLATEV